MTVILVIFLVIVIIALFIWVKKLKQSLKEHFMIEGELQYAIGHDALTDLVNVPLTVDRLSQAIKNSQRYNNKIAVLYLGIDYFKQINNASGFDIYNEFLQVLSDRFLENVDRRDTVAIVNGNEFVIILENFDDSAYVTEFIDKFMDISHERFKVHHHQIKVTFSLGVSVYPNDNADAITLLSHASTAMNLIKNSGGDGYKFYTPELAQQAYENEKLEYELVDSLKNEEIQLYYQPQIDIKTNKMIGMEALIRWRHPEMGLISPERFITLSEEIGFIVDLDKWVMQEAIRQFRKWYEAGLEPGKLSLNLSTQRLDENGFLEEIQDILQEGSYAKNCFSFEVRETQIMQNPERYLKKLHQLHALGISLSADDFGTDSSSLAFLKKLPIDKLKIDRVLVKGIGTNKDDESMIKNIISIAKSMNITTVAEGVENQEQRDFLCDNACTDMQGYLYHKPLSVAEVEEKLRSIE